MTPPTSHGVPVWRAQYAAGSKTFSTFRDYVTNEDLEPGIWYPLAARAEIRARIAYPWEDAGNHDWTTVQREAFDRGVDTILDLLGLTQGDT
ncbi:MAG: hypothetical protein H0X39_00100 [Actinobacteria bacterium]|nr:hypothetical protein [Actinomycetota bacterium]